MFVQSYIILQDCYASLSQGETFKSNTPQIDKSYLLGWVCGGRQFVAPAMRSLLFRHETVTEECFLLYEMDTGEQFML